MGLPIHTPGKMSHADWAIHGVTAIDFLKENKKNIRIFHKIRVGYPLSLRKEQYFDFTHVNEHSARGTAVNIASYQFHSDHLFLK